MKTMLISAAGGLLLLGCAGPSAPEEPVVNVDAAMEFLEPGLRPEVLLFPDYLLMNEYELNQHGRIPESRLIGAGLRTKLSLSVVRKEFSDILDAKGWNTAKMEIERQSFRIIATLQDQEIEIRAVQGSGATEIFMMYFPGAAAPDDI